jgi:hypothetical protein
MTKAQRKRRAVIGAIALLEWRDRMAREDADREMVRAKYEEMVRARYDLMVAEMRTQADEFWKPRAASQTPCKLIKGMVHSNGAAGALS